MGAPKVFRQLHMVMVCYRGEKDEWAECNKGKCQGTQAAQGHAAVALETNALNAEKAHAQLQKSVAKGRNYRNTKLQATSDSALQEKLRTMTCWGRKTPVTVQGGQKTKKVKERKDEYVKKDIRDQEGPPQQQQDKK